MTFCDSCGKKLSNNFQDWKKFNAGKSFNDYKAEINATEEIIPQVRKKKGGGKNQIILMIGLIIAALLLAEGYYLGFAGKKLFNDIMTKRAEIGNVADSPNWRLTEDKTGNFKIRFPGNATKDIQTQEMESETVYFVSYILEPDPVQTGNHLYGITFLKYPANIVSHSLMKASELDEFFLSVINGSATSMGGEIKSISEQNFKKFPGRIAIVSMQNGEMEISYWSLLVDNTLYILQVIHSPENASNESMDTFFNSFQLMEE